MTTTQPTDCTICGLEVHCGHVSVPHKDGEAHWDCKVSLRAIDQGRTNYCAGKRQGVRNDNTV